MRAEGYGADVDFDGETITVIPRGLGKAAPGTSQRQIRIGDLSTVNFKGANPLVNGHLELTTDEGSTLVHFRRKHSAAMSALYEQLHALVHGDSMQTGTDTGVAPASTTAPPGWHDATDRPGFWRWWDGRSWTDQYHAKEPLVVGAELPGAPMQAWATKSTRQNVVGEQNYAPAFQKLLHRQRQQVGGYGTEISEIQAAVIADPGNAYDRNAVAVYVEGELVGYLARDVAAAYTGPLQDLADQGRHLSTTARVWIAPDDDERVGSVTVALPPPEGVQSFNEPPEQPYQVLPAGSAIQVTAEEDYMDVLGAYVADRDRYLAVTLHIVQESKTERSTPYQAVEVRLDGHRVGVLTKAMSEKIADVVEFVTAKGRVPVCQAVLTGSPLRAELVLHVAKSHEVTRRWMDTVQPA